MLNHNAVIEKMTIKQKFSLLTDIGGLSSPELNQIGVPYVSVTSLEKLLTDGDEGLSPSRLANSWDEELIERLTGQVVTESGSTGAKLLLTPAAKPRMNIYRPALSEDPVLSGRLAAAYANGVRKAGGACCIDGFYLTRSDVEQMDLTPDATVMGEMLVKPYMIAAKHQSFKGVMSVNPTLRDGYRDINERIFRLNDAVNMFNGTARLCSPKNDDETLDAILAGSILVKGGLHALEKAYEKYQYVLKSIEDEISTAEDLDEALADGSAISDDMLNQAVDRVLDFAEAVASNLEKAAPVGADAKREAIAASCVLLKNQKSILPLHAGARVAVIGHLGIENGFAEAVCQKAGARLLGTAEGYAADTLTDGAEVEQAVALAKKADRVLLFLGVSREAGKKMAAQRELSLPANQVALISALKAYKDKLVGIVDCDQALDMSFAGDLAALLLAPIGGTEGTEALADILSGRVNPSGKLAATLYVNPSEHFASLRRDKEAGKNKVGLFMGYRHYDSSELAVQFPFGHGLSYTTFRYSNLKVSKDHVIFTVQNTGKRAGAEVSQVYVGKAESATLRPRRELFGFVKTVLKPGEKREIRMDLSQLAFYDETADRWVRESGVYTFSVGSSVRDIRMSVVTKLAGEAYVAGEAKQSDYLQAYSNVLTDEYLVEPRMAKPKKHWKLKMTAILALLGAIAVIAVWYKIWGRLDRIAYASGGGLLALSMLLWIVDACRKKKSRKKREAQIRMGKEKYLKTAEEKNFQSIEELFVEEFDTVGDVVETEEKAKVYVDDTSKYIDLNYTVSQAAEDLESFMKARGMAFASTGSIRLLAAMAASRLVVADVNGVNRDRFYGALVEYFGSPVCMETLRGEYVQTHLLYRRNGDGLYEKSDLVQLIESAETKKNVMHLAILRQAKADALFDLFMPYLKYFSNPLRENRIIVKEPTASFVLPSNLWFVVELADGEALDAAQAGVVKAAAALKLTLSDCEAAPLKDPAVGIGYYQFDHFIQQQKGRFSMSEDLWKKVDALEAYMASLLPYHIGNKQWLQMEKYLSFLTLAEEDMATALDACMSVNLIPELTSLMKGKIASGERELLVAMEQIFGDDKIPLCTKLLKNRGASNANQEL